MFYSFEVRTCSPSEEQGLPWPHPREGPGRQGHRPVGRGPLGMCVCTALHSHTHSLSLSHTHTELRVFLTCTTCCAKTLGTLKWRCSSQLSRQQGGVQSPTNLEWSKCPNNHIINLCRSVLVWDLNTVSWVHWEKDIYTHTHTHTQTDRHIKQNKICPRYD